MQPVIELAGLGVRFGSRDILKDLRVSLVRENNRVAGAEWGGEIDADSIAAGILSTDGGDGFDFRARHPE